MERKMVSAFYIALIVLLTAIFIFSSASTLGNTYIKTCERAQFQADALTDDVNNTLNYYLDMCLNVSTNTLITDIFYNTNNYTIQDFVDDNNFLNKYFSSFREIEAYIPEQFCIYVEEELPVQGTYIKHISHIKDQKLRFKLERAELYEFIWQYDRDGYGRNYLSVYRKIYAPNSYTAYFEIKIPLEKMVKGFVNLSPEFEGAQLMASNGTLMYSSGKTDGYKEFIGTAVNGDKIIIYMDMNKAMEDSYLSFALFLLLYVFLLFGMRIVSQKIVAKLNGELNEFIDLLSENDGLMLNSDSIVIDGNSDIATIKEKFKELIESNNRLHKNIEIANKKRQYAELNFLQYSINPHLLYNSLSSIKWCVIDKSEQEVSQIIDSITEYYRIVLSGGENFITIKEELCLIERYVNIMRVVYDTEIELAFDVDETLNDTYTIKMLLQPVVENSILHGLNGVAGAKLTIGVHRNDDYTVFTVSDNGYGMDIDTKNNILSGIKNKKRKNYGIKNVLDRIKCYYGDECDLTINSTPNKGTEVTITIKTYISPPNDEGDA